MPKTNRLEVDWRRLVEHMDEKIIARYSKDDVETRKLEKAGCYPYIPLRFETFIVELTTARDALGRKWKRSGCECCPDHRATSFVDVGCGIGTKLLIALQFGTAVTGIELNPKYAEVARRLVGRDRIIEGDALEQDYSSYDIIYFYNPLQDAKKELALERRIVEQAKSGVLILANRVGMYGEKDSGAREKLWADRKQLKPIGDYNVYQKL